MRKILFVCALFFAANAGAYFNGGLNYTGGANGYSGSTLWLVLGSDNFWLQPSMTSYESDYTNATFKDYKVRVGYDTSLYSLAGGVGSVPESDGYENVYAEADITFTLTAGGSRRGRLAGPQASAGAVGGDGMTRIDVGAGAKYIMHEDKYNLLGQKIASPLEVNQTDLSLFAGVKFFSLALSGTYTKSSYDETLTPEVRPFQNVNIPGLITVVQAYPESSLNLRADLPSMPFVSPYVSYGKTKFKQLQSDLKTYTFGGVVDFSMLKVNAAYQVQDAGDADGYFTMGASINF